MFGVLSILYLMVKSLGGTESRFPVAHIGLQVNKRNNNKIKKTPKAKTLMSTHRETLKYTVEDQNKRERKNTVHS